MENLSVICASLMAGEGVINGFTEKMKQVFTGGYWSINPSHTNFNQKLIRMVKEYKPTIVFLQIQTPGIITIETAKEIAKHSFIINWSGDIRVETPPQWYLDIGRYIQLTAFSNMKDVKGCREQGLKSDWLECGFNPEIYRKWDTPIKTREIVAHFNDGGYNRFPLSQYRLDIVNVLRSEFKDRFGVFGNSQGAIADFNSNQLAEAKNYSNAKIAINCSHFRTEKYSSDRLSRIMGTGGAACISHYFPCIGQMYDLGNHLYTFDNLNELVKLCHNLLNNEDERKRIALAGQKHALKNYTFEEMCKNIVKLYELYK